ncbi:MAG: hypothetical protein NC201_07770 [Prevotella sp.]|nr:hypothetical protein [Bacteroides sp.]MCM1367126.1 hypothetical protein [Prevotella sp.]MCM1437440.1 hypothetical protein [Prevotella sp.]
MKSYIKLLSLPIITALFAVSSTSASAQELADTAGYNKFRFGSYGEAVASFKDYGINKFLKDGATKEHRNTIAIPRFTLGINYKFTPKWIFGAEIEFEAGGTGSAVELENNENGEYETEIEKGGEVALEQLHITRLITREFNVRVGHQIIPIGLTNAHHEPILFFGTERPESQTAMMPSTWHETGLTIFGTFGKGLATFDYEAMVVAGLNANGFDRDTWIASGKQGFFETDNFTSPGYVARIDWRGVPGLRTGVAFYYCHNTGANADKSEHYAAYGRIPLEIFTWDATYANKYITVRADLTYGHLGNTKAVNDRNNRLPNASPYSRLTPVAKNALSYGAEIGFDFGKTFRIKGCPKFVPFARYEYFNPQKSVAKPFAPDNRLEVSKWAVGLNWFPLPNLVVKADYNMRQIGTQKIFGKGPYNSQNEFCIGIAYVGWFIRK